MTNFNFFDLDKNLLIDIKINNKDNTFISKL